MATLLALSAFIFLHEISDFDLYLQDYLFYSKNNGWLINAEEPTMKAIFYRLPRAIVIAFGVFSIFVALLSRHFTSLKKYGQSAKLMSLSLIFVPLTICAGKATTDIHCPSELVRYGGYSPYVKLFEKRPDLPSNLRGRGFPAGHASGGFALMMLAFLWQGHFYCGLLVGLCAGWTMGIYQMAKGAHFLSHTIVSMLVAWAIIVTILIISKQNAIKQTNITDL